MPWFALHRWFAQHPCRCAKTRHERVEAFKAWGMNMADYVAADGSGRVIVGVVVHDMDGMRASKRSVMTWTSPTHVAVYKAWGSPRGYEGEYRPYGDVSATIEPVDHVLEPAPGPALAVPTVLLQSAFTYSAAENFVLVMQQMPQVTTMGTTTAGSTGQPLIIRLPNGVFAGITSKRDMTPEGEDFVGFGLSPEVELVDRPDAIAEGRDLPLERALEYVLEVGKS
jgi:hypothetical protein